MSLTTISQRAAKSRKLRMEQEADAMIVELTNFLNMVRDSVEFNLGRADQPSYVYELRLTNKFVPVGSTRYSNCSYIEANTKYLTYLIATVPEVQAVFLEFRNFCDREGLCFKFQDDNHGWCHSEIFKHIEFIVSERDLECEMEPEHVTGHSINKTASFRDRLYYLIVGSLK